MLGLGSLFLKLFFGEARGLAKEIAGVKKARIAAENTQKKYELDERLAILENQRQEYLNATKIRLAMTDHIEMRFLVFIIAGVFILHAAMVVLDSTFKFEMVIDALPQPYAEYQGRIIMSFFGLAATRQIVKGFLMR